MRDSLKIGASVARFGRTVNEISFIGTPQAVKAAKDVIGSAELTGDEPKDRLIIQNLIDMNGLKAHILYNGNFVYGYDRLAKEIKRMKKSGSIEKLSKTAYTIFSGFDIAHYSREGFIYYFGGSYLQMKRACQRGIDSIPSWHTDLQKLAECM
jgi:hypothetical protein